MPREYLSDSNLNSAELMAAVEKAKNDKIRELIEMLNTDKEQRKSLKDAKKHWYGWYDKEDKIAAIDKCKDALNAILNVSVDRASIQSSPSAESSQTPGTLDKKTLKVLKDGTLGESLAQFITSYKDVLGTAIPFAQHFIKKEYGTAATMSHLQRNSVRPAQPSSPPAASTGCFSSFARLFCCCRPLWSSVPTQENVVNPQ